MIYILISAISSYSACEQGCEVSSKCSTDFFNVSMDQTVSAALFFLNVSLFIRNPVFYQASEIIKSLFPPILVFHCPLFPLKTPSDDRRKVWNS